MIVVAQSAMQIDTDDEVVEEQKFSVNIDGIVFAETDVEVRDTSGDSHAPGDYLENLGIYTKNNFASSFLARHSWQSIESTLNEFGELYEVGLFISPEYPHTHIKFSCIFSSLPRWLEYYDVSSDRMYCKVSVSTQAAQWNHPWTISDYLTNLLTVLKERHLLFGIRDKTGVTFPIRSFEYRLSNVNLAEPMNAVRAKVEQAHRETIELLEARLHKDTVTVRFDFPQAVKTSCEQYLLYFAQFLRDLGIDATTDLKHDASSVLFTVIPSTQDKTLDKEAALHAIRKALDFYLKVPTDPAFSSTPAFGEAIEVQRLVSQVQFYQSQLTLAQVTIQQQALSIQSALQMQQGQYLQSAVNAPNPPPVIVATQINNNVLLESKKSDNAPPDHAKDYEPIFGGGADILPVEGKGFRLNLPMWVRGFKEWYASQKAKPVSTGLVRKSGGDIIEGEIVEE